MIAQLPVKEKKIKKRTRHFFYFILRDGNKIAMKKRTGKDIWNGLYEFYLVEADSAKKLTELVKTDRLLAVLKDVREVGNIRHVLTHQTLFIKFYEADVNPAILGKTKGSLGDHSFISIKKAESMPKPIALTKFLEQANY